MSYDIKYAVFFILWDFTSNYGSDTGYTSSSCMQMPSATLK
jgi:hypothetical protein